MKFLNTFALCLVLAGAALLPTQAKADEWNKKTVITINEPLAVPGKVLQPGTYVLKLQDSPADRHIVEIFNQDESQIQATILAIPNYRIEPANKTQFSYWEMPAGQPRALRAWFYPGDNFGQEFAYPKELASTIAQTNNANVPTVNENNAMGTTAPNGASAAATPPPAPAPEQEQQPSSVAQNQPPEPPAPPTQPAQPPAPAPQPQALTPAPAPALPRTASPFPLIGLAGLLSLGAAFITRAVAHSV